MCVRVDPGWQNWWPCRLWVTQNSPLSIHESRGRDSLDASSQEEWEVTSARRALCLQSGSTHSDRSLRLRSPPQVSPSLCLTGGGEQTLAPGGRPRGDVVSENRTTWSWKEKTQPQFRVYSRNQSITCRFSQLLSCHTSCGQALTEWVLNNIVNVLERTSVPLGNSDAHASHTWGFPFHYFPLALNNALHWCEFFNFYILKSVFRVSDTKQ